MAAKFNVGDAVSYVGEANTKVYVEKGLNFRQEYFIQREDQRGTAKGEWVHKTKLVPYGTDTGKQKPPPQKIAKADGDRSHIHRLYR